MINFYVKNLFTGSNIDATAKVWMIGKELPDDLTGEVKNSNMRSATRSSAGNNLSYTITINVTSGKVDTADKLLVVGKEL